MSDLKLSSTPKKRRYGPTSSSSSSSSSSSGLRRAGFKRMRNMATNGAFGVHSFKETIDKGYVQIAPSTSGVSGAITIAPTELGNFTSLAGVFDQMRIIKIRVRFIPTGEQVYNLAAAVQGLPSTAANGPLHTVIDYDDDTAPTSAQCREYANCRYAMTGKYHSRTFVPTVLMQAYETSIATAYVPKKYQWIDMADTGTLHYGLKYAQDTGTNSGATALRLYSIFVDVWYQCKNQR